MMAPGPLEALPALLDIVANDERAAELSAAPYVAASCNGVSPQ